MSRKAIREFVAARLEGYISSYEEGPVRLFDGIRCVRISRRSMEKEFKDLFKCGDVICSDYFRNGLIMIVSEYDEGHGRFFGPSYRCDDLFLKYQGWCAHEFQDDCLSRSRPYNWRLATDKDYERSLLNYMDSKYTLSNLTDVIVDDKGIYIIDGVILNPREALELRDIINKHVGE